MEIKDELSQHVFQLLIVNEAVIQFEQGELAKSSGTKKRKTTKTTVKKNSDPVDPQTDSILHTELDPEELDDRLISLFTDANASFQEKGINVLYLAMGFLRWCDDEGKSFDAPLILVPVELLRDKAGVRFSIKWTGHEIETNLTLKIRLKIDFDIALPEVPDVEEMSVEAYFKEVRRVIANKGDWELLEDDMVLWFFSFTKLMMYRDLDPDTWPDDKPLEERTTIRGLLGEGFAPVESLCADDAVIDSLFDPAQTAHVIDCDSSQSLIIEEACRGRSLVIQGPPGTGKSQTITNLIAAAVHSGKTILFVAEKMAALEVVKRRLDNIGIGDMCLELHSNKAKKREVLQELDRTLKLGSPKLPDKLQDTVNKLRERRDELNSYVDCMHTPQSPSGMTPYQVLTELIDLRASGVSLPDYKMDEAIGWSGEQFQANNEAIEELSRVLGNLGNVAEHPWRGCELDQILPLDLERLVTAVPKSISSTDELIESVRAFRKQLGDDPALSLSDVSKQLNTVEALLSAPALDAQAATNTIWIDNRKAVGEMADGARAVLLAKEKLNGVVSDAAWDTDVAQARQDYATHGQSFFRIFYSLYRAARNTLNSLLVGPAPDPFEGRLKILNLLYGHQKGVKDAVDNSSLGEKAFGKFWLGNKTDWQRVVDWETWDTTTTESGASPRFRALLTLLDDPASLKTRADDVKTKLNSFADGFCSICDSLQLNIPAAFGTAAVKAAPDASPAQHKPDAANLLRLRPAVDVHLTDIRDRMAAWKDNPEGLQHWRQYSRSRKVIQNIAGGAIAAGIDNGTIEADQISPMFRFAFFESVLRKVLKDNPTLEAFDGDRFEQRIGKFQALDSQRLQLARAEVAAGHWAGIGRKRAGNMAEAVGLLRHEMQKKRRHLPLRVLLRRAGNAVQAIKPVFMMSPLSVSQYLDPAVLEFDILLIDEASQVRPVEALGAAARCRQMVVVGDDKRMPPTQFFGVVVGDVDLDDEESPAMQAGDVESILGLCIAKNMPQRMLRWHYRSKHESLIAVSNREFYDGRLYVIPSAYRTGELGVKHRYIENGGFRSGQNLIEAQVVAEAIIQHAKDRPNWTLGVGAFSVSQRDTIIKALEALRKETPELESFFDPNAPDPFFVKNLENIQGDERDGIFVSCGYGPGDNGQVSLNFGPVSSSGGERRLNVLMTRAKRRCEIFASLRAEDIDLNRATGRGPAAFREYLRFAQTGAQVEGAISSESTDRLVEVLKTQLAEKGYEVRTHVGIAGVFVDLAVVDPENSDRYLLGIDVDGESYRTSRSARDRDRTRAAVLGSQGWSLHRIWSLEWFKRPTEQLNEVISAIEKARKGKGKSSSGAAAREFEIQRQTGGPDPLSTAVGDLQPVPERSDAPEIDAATAGEEKSLTSEIFGSVLKAGLAAATAKKGRGLDAAIRSLGKK